MRSRVSTSLLKKSLRQTFRLVSSDSLLDFQWKERFQKMDQKLDFSHKQLEMQIAANRVSLESLIEATRENLETQIKSNDKQLAQLRKILWIVLTLVLGLFAKAIHLF